MFVLPNNPASPYWNQNCIGCTDSQQRNYDPNAIIDNGTCSYIFDLSLQGIMDFTVPTGGNTGKAVHLQATDSISDLSVYSIRVASNGSSTF